MEEIFKNRLYDILLNSEDIDLQKIFTDLLLDITNSHLGYFNDLVKKNGEFYNKGSYIIDTRGKIGDKEKEEFKETYFPIKNNEDKLWSQNYYKKEICWFDMRTYDEKKCPFTGVNFYCILPMIYKDDILGCIALGSDENNFQPNVQGLKNISKVISNLLWKNKYQVDRQIAITAKKTYNLYDFVSSAFNNKRFLNNIYKIEYVLLLKIMNIFNCQYGFVSEMSSKNGTDAYFSKLIADNSSDQKLYKTFMEDNPDGVFFEFNMGPNHPPHMPYYTNKPYVNNDMNKYYKSNKQHCPITFKNFYIAPLLFDNKKTGALALANRNCDFDDEFKKDIKIYLEIFSNLIWSKMNLEKHIKTQSQHVMEIEKNKRNKYYLSQISHELRTPLNAIIGFSQLLKEDKNNIDEYLEYILENSNELLGLVNDSLNLNKLDFLEIKKINLNLETIIRNIMKSDFKRDDVEVSISISKDIYVSFDEDLLKHLLRNLITNASKYTSKSGKFKIFTEYSGEKIIVHFKNTGLFKIRKRDFIFSPFNKGIHTEKGHGLGLSILKKICDITEENIFFREDKEKEEVMFSITFQKENIDSIPKILYIEDNIFNQKLIQKVFNKNLIVNCLDNAHDLTILHKYEYLFLDWHLNDINGIDVIKYIKEKQLNIKVIVLTADTNPETITYFEENNIPFLNKPINLKELKKYIFDIFKIQMSKK